jgi:hypothetical protein
MQYSVWSEVPLPDELWCDIISQCHLVNHYRLVSHGWTHCVESCIHPYVQEWAKAMKQSNRILYMRCTQCISPQEILQSHIEDAVTASLLLLLSHWPHHKIPAWFMFAYHLYSRCCGNRTNKCEINELCARLNVKQSLYIKLCLYIETLMKRDPPHLFYTMVPLKSL